MIHNEHAHLQVVARSHPGLVRTNNEDRFAVSAFRLSADNATPALFAVLCDGIGGHRAGEVAAEMAVNLVSQYVAKSDASQPLATLQEAITMASQNIFECAQGDAGQQGMGATCACAWVIGNKLFTASVGDSRLYLLHDHVLVQISTDHTWVQEAVDRSIITPEQAQGHRNAHVIRRYLGSLTPPEIDFRLRLNRGESDDQATANQGVSLAAQDMVLLCSDGLTDLVNAAEIQAQLQNQSPEAAVQALIDLVLQRGGYDNTTLVLLKVPDPNQSSRATPGRRKLPLRWVLLGCLGLLLLAVLVILVGLILASLLNIALPFAIQIPHLAPFH